MVRRSDTPVYGIVDGRVVTCYAFQKIFGPEKVKYDLVISSEVLKGETKSGNAQVLPRYIR